jgi:hypothetical protein
MAVRRQGSLPRSAALIALAALAVHQLRYGLAYGSKAHAELAAQGHTYLLHSLPVLIGLGVATLAAGLLRAALGTTPGGAVGSTGWRSRMPVSAAARALLYAASIASAFAIQETVEGLLFAGHASGIAAVFGNGGWLALPLALVCGAICTLLDGGLAKLESLVARRPPASMRPRAPRSCGAAAQRAAPHLASLPLAFGLARRPPPLRP